MEKHYIVTMIQTHSYAVTIPHDIVDGARAAITAAEKAILYRKYVKENNMQDDRKLECKHLVEVAFMDWGKDDVRIDQYGLLL